MAAGAVIFFDFYENSSSVKTTTIKDQKNSSYNFQYSYGEPIRIGLF
jgi:hypothetical protein